MFPLASQSALTSLAPRRALRLALAAGVAGLVMAGAAALGGAPGWSAAAALAATVAAMGALIAIAIRREREPAAAEPAPLAFDAARFLQESPEAAFIIDLDGVIRGANAHCEALAAATRPLAGQSVSEALPGPIVEAAATALEHNLNSTGAIECENQIGEWLIVDLSIRPCSYDGVPAFALVMRDLTEVRRREIELATLAFQDPLTHIGNRAAVERRLARLKDDLAEGPEASFAVIVIDLDGFKAVNDRLGHAAGDRLLVEVSRRIVASLPRNAFVGRNGGDEFVVVVGPRVQRAAARQFAERLFEAASGPVALPAGFAEVGASIGVALAPADGDEAEALLAAADRAMYRAKRCGGGVCFAGDEDAEPLRSVA